MLTFEKVCKTHLEKLTPQHLRLGLISFLGRLLKKFILWYFWLIASTFVQP